jgi:GNAT superfamily N-acetyltransferase
MSTAARSEAHAAANEEAGAGAGGEPDALAVRLSALGAPTATAGWRVRRASSADVAQVAGAVAELLVELGGAPGERAAMEDTTRTLIEEPRAGGIVVAEWEGTLIGVLAASWQSAIHVPGRYGLIQDLWVHPSWRSNAIGAGLLAALAELAREAEIDRLEVGLPRASFAGVEATEAFYRRNGFALVGARMRTVLR